jgi:hypothetical protein
MKCTATAAAEDLFAPRAVRSYPRALRECVRTVNRHHRVCRKREEIAKWLQRWARRRNLPEHELISNGGTVGKSIAALLEEQVGWVLGCVARAEDARWLCRRLGMKWLSWPHVSVDRVGIAGAILFPVIFSRRGDERMSACELDSANVEAFCQTSRFRRSHADDQVR